MDGCMHACMGMCLLLLQCVPNQIWALVFGTEKMYVGLVCANLTAFKFSPPPFFSFKTFLQFLNQLCFYK
jgi:hypothetical protein